MKHILILLLIIVLSILIHYFEWEIGLRILIVTMLFTSGFLMYKQLKVLWKYFTYYMFNIKINFFDKRIERPRLFVYLTIGIASLIMFRLFIKLESDQFLNKALFGSLLLTIYWCFSYMLYFTWGAKFQEKFIVKVEKQLLKTNDKSYQLEWTKEEFTQLYYNLVDFDFIECPDGNTTDRLQFVEILTEGKIPNDPIFKLKMSNVQTKYFWDLLSANSKGFTLDIFLKIFKNKNAKASRSSIEVSFSKAGNRFNGKNRIDECFAFKK